MQDLSIIRINENEAIVVDSIGPIERETVYHYAGSYSRGYNGHNDVIEINTDDGMHFVKINKCAFSYCKDLKRIIIGRFVRKIDWNMYGCTSLMDINVDPNNEIFRDIDGVLFENTTLRGFPQARTGVYVIPEGTTRIGNHAFKGSKLTQIILPNSLEEIGINAFYDCKRIKEFILPNSIKRVYSNCNQGNQPISQKFYLSSDKNKSYFFSIEEIRKLFPA